MELLRTDKLSISYDKKIILDNISFSLGEGEILGILGESGSGKSTLLRGITGLLGPEGEMIGGNIAYRGMNLTKMTHNEMRRILGKEIETIFQDCVASFCPVRKIGIQICESVRAHVKMPRREIKYNAFELMKKVNLRDCERIWNSYPFELSGGMSQRVGICAAMILKPNILLADEPASALDSDSTKQVIDELLMMRHEYNTAMIVVSHDENMIRRIADRIIVINDGKIIDSGDAERMMSDGF